MQLPCSVVAVVCLLANTHAPSDRGQQAAVVSAPMQSARAFWEDWAKSRKYKLVANKDQRVLLMVPEERGRQERTLELVEKSLARADELLPARPAAEAKPNTSGDAKPTWNWGAVDNPLESDPIVFGLFRKPAEYADALEFIGGFFPYLGSWIAKGKQDPGCILERPLFGGCVDNVPGMQEWNPENEVVHRIAQLAMIRRCGRQPVWVGLGVGWNVEFDLLNTIYCFPWRNGFVSVHEHGGWEADLRRTFGKREKQPLAIDELAAIHRGGFDLAQAAIAWGTVRFLAQNHAAELEKLLDEFRALHDRLGRVPTGDGKNWTMAADFEVPADEQKNAFEKIVAKDVFAQASDWFRLGKKWKKPTVGG